MTMLVLQAAGALVLLYLGGEALVRGACVLALRIGVSGLAVGLTVVAFGTSAPELVVSLDAALTGANDISVGNVVGSNIANVLLILGLAALIRPLTVEAKIVRLDTPLMILVSAVLIVMLADGETSRLEGFGLLVGLCGYSVLTLVQARRESLALRESMPPGALPAATHGLRGAGLVVAGLGLLIAGGHLLVGSAVTIAASLGVSQAVIGLTIVAVGTSLPELATSAVASLRGQGDIAAGNVVGSNMFNILGILGVTAFIQPLRLGGITSLDLGVMAAAACALMALLVVARGVGRIAGAGLLTGYAAYTATLLAA